MLDQKSRFCGVHRRGNRIKIPARQKCRQADKKGQTQTNACVKIRFIQVIGEQQIPNALAAASAAFALNISNEKIATGLTLAKLSAKTTEALDQIVPSYGNTANPVDVNENADEISENTKVVETKPTPAVSASASPTKKAVN